ncbi:NUMOD3 domain-containing DNA-binding protein [Methylobacterium sp. 37f]|uniref:NUMOD3 domain-containing DNA-binding protein n=1 Tax=Methylobacterium sp. 37f TaxID=2817058 RepID=UPI001FFD32EE|nr:NUMOD3 domain-containing DNA-binding protein [Methylobacterium sp. 37f]MCK2054770.1 hypothetical protein [Methylobacterium sp. 37f]
MKHTQETKNKIAAARTGAKHTDATRQAISSSLKGRYRTEEHRAALSKPKSEAHKAAIAEAARQYWARVRAAMAAQDAKN